MSTYSVAEAKNRLPALIDKAIQGEEVVITRYGKPVAELHASAPREATTKSRPSKALLRWMLSRRNEAVGITSVELLDQMYEDDGG
jgi:prevent-host-death family protein